MFARRFPISTQHLFVLVALLTAVLAAGPLLLGPGLLNTRGGGDSPFLLQRLQQLEMALRDGHFPVRWMPDANYGYGYPFYNFYAPLSVYVTAVFRFLGFSYVGAIKLSQLSAFLVAAAGMYALARRWLGSPWAGLLAAAAYTFAPFHMVNVYVRGDSLAEFWAMAFYPLALLAADRLRIADYGLRKKNVALLALAYAGLILSHNISALIFSPFLLLYLLLLLWRRPSPHNSQFTIYNSQFILHTPTALLLAFALAAWFFIPALAEKGMAQLGPVTGGYFHFSNHFRGANLVQSGLLFDYGVDGGNAFRMGLAQASTAVVGLIAMLFCLTQRSRGAEEQRGKAMLACSPAPLLFTALMLLISTLMITPLSRPLWEHVPLLDFTQFPWRFLSVQALGGALATAVLALLPGRRVITPVLVALLAVAALGRLQPDFLPLTDADVTAVRLAEYEWYTGNIGSTVSAEYLYPAVQPRPVTSAWLTEGNRDRVIVLDGAADVRLVERQADRQTWQVSVTAVSGATLIFPTMYWPGWQAEVDGQPVALAPSSGSGLLQLVVPSGEHAITLRLTRTPVRLVAEIVSGTAVLLVGWLLWPWPRPGRWLLAGLVGLLLLALAARVWPSSNVSPDTLNWDFAQMAYLHPRPEGAPFTDGLTLVNYAYSQEMLAPGDTLTLTLNWDNAPVGTPVTVGLYSPAITRPPLLAQVEPVPIANATLPLAAPMQFTLVVPQNVPSGLYVPRLTVAGQTAQTAAGLARGDLFLRPVRVVAGMGEQGDEGAGEMDVRVVTAVVRAAEPVLDLQVAWWTARPLSHNVNISLRLTDGQGEWLRQLDTQPGFGFLPSSGWPVGRWANDWLALSLPNLPPDAGPYPLVVQAYDVSAPETAVLTRRLGQLVAGEDGLVFVVNEPAFDLPEGVQEGGATAVFGEEITLAAYTLTQTDGQLTLTLYWRALRNGQANYTRFVHLVSAAGGPPLAQDDSYPVFNSYPTGQWTAGEIVTDVVNLDLSGVAPGEYALAVGFYERLAEGGVERVTAVGENGRPLPDSQFILEIGDRR